MNRFEQKIADGIITVIVKPRRVEIVDKHMGSIIVDHKTAIVIADAIKHGVELVNGE